MANIALISGTGLAVTNVAAERRIFYQLSDGSLEQSDDSTGIWISEDTTPKPVILSPLATVTDKSGTVHAFSLDKDYILQEYSSQDNGKTWVQGDINKQKVQAVPGSGLAAVVFTDANASELISVYCQCQNADGTRTIKQLTNVNCKQWVSYDVNTPQEPLGGTALAAVAQASIPQDIKINLYYQDKDLSVKETIFSYADPKKGWADGTLEAKAAGRSPLGAVIYKSTEIQVYWRSACGSVKFARFYSSAWRRAVAIDGVEAAYQLTVSELNSGKKLGLYYQTSGGAIREHLSDDGGNTWGCGARLT